MIDVCTRAAHLDDLIRTQAGDTGYPAVGVSYREEEVQSAEAHGREASVRTSSL